MRKTFVNDKDQVVFMIFILLRLSDNGYNPAKSRTYPFHFALPDRRT